MEVYTKRREMSIVLLEFFLPRRQKNPPEAEALGGWGSIEEKIAADGREPGIACPVAQDKMALLPRDGKVPGLDLAGGTVKVQGVAHVLRQLQERGHRLSTILMTVLPTQKIVRDATELGAAYVFPKPFSSQAMIEKIQELLKHAPPTKH